LDQAEYRGVSFQRVVLEVDCKNVALSIKTGLDLSKRLAKLVNSVDPNDWELCERRDLFL